MPADDFVDADSKLHKIINYSGKSVILSDGFIWSIKHQRYGKYLTINVFV